MKPLRSSLYQRRLDTILETYRDKEPRPGAEKRHLLRLWHEYVFPLRWHLVLAIFFTILMQIQPYVWAIMGKITTDTILMVGKTIPPAEMARHITWTFIVFTTNCSYHVLLIISNWQASYQVIFIGQKVVFELRKVLHEKLQALPLAFFEGIQTGKLLSIVVDDVDTIRQSVANTGPRVISSLVTILLGAGFVYWQSWVAGVLVLIALPCYAYTFHTLRPRIREANIAARRGTAVLYSRMEERVTAVRVVKLFGRERAEVRSFTEQVNNLARLMLHIVRLSSWQTLIAATISGVTSGIILWYGLYLLRTDPHFTLGSCLMLYGNVTVMFGPAAIFGDLALEVQRISVVMRRVFDIIEAEPEPPDREDALKLTHAHGDIVFQNVTFRYPGDEHPSLTDVSFAVPAGKQVAVMGPSGAGKSSLLYLLMRFYDPEDGSITLDGHDLRDVKLLSLRDRVTLVLQEPVIFSGTVAENIRYGRMDASDAEVQRTAKDADLHEFIMSLPDSYDTVVGERGMSLSGGQRQRLALAASLISQPSVLLLDDTTSALDARTESRVRATLNRLMKGRTCFVVTHRVSTALASDLVLVLEDGGRTQFGPPSVLLAEEGLFRRVYEQQLRESADGAMVVPTVNI